MREVLKDFGMGAAAVLFAGLVMWGVYALGSAFNKLSALPAIVGIGLLVFCIVAFTYFIGRFLRGK